MDRTLKEDAARFPRGKLCSVSRTITDTICVANKPVTRAVADDLSGAFFDRGAFPGTLVTVEQRKIG